MNKTRIQILLLIVVMMFAGLITGSLAYWRLQQDSVSVLNMNGPLDGVLIDDNKEITGVFPGDRIERIVQVKNAGELDFIVRLKVEKSWADTSSSLSTDLITVPFNNTEWLNGGDGYFYYKGILKSGESTKPLFTEISLAPTADSSYMGKKANVDVTMECLQSTANAIKIWNKTYADLGITAPKTPSGKTATIILTSKKKLEVGSGSNSALFPNFNAMTPGETREQVVNIENEWSKEVKFYLRAESVKQAVSSSSYEADYIDHLLTEYATMTVTNLDGDIIYEGPANGNYNKSVSGADSFKKDISLGKLKAGDDEDFVITLQLDPTMDNDYQKLAGKIKWIITAEGADSSGSSVIELPYTGGSIDTEQSLLIWSILFSTVMALGFLIILTDKKRNQPSD